MDDGTSIQLQEWIARLHAGDSKARDELIQRALSRLRNLAHLSLGQFARIRRFEDTDDVLQASLIRLMRRLEAVHPATASDFFRLAAASVRRTLLDLTKHYFGPLGAGACESPLTQGGHEGSQVYPETGSDTLDANRLADWAEFHRQVELLPADESDVFAMIWYNDLKQEEVAAALGVSIATVKRRWLAARMRLQHWLDGEKVLSS